MSSAQVANTTTMTTPNSGSSDRVYYQYRNVDVRDASDWTRRLKEQDQYSLYRSGYSGNKDTGPTWIKHGNQFRYTYLFGKLKCTTPETCSGAVFSGGTKAVVGGV
jgi:hypothetical protein